MPELFQLWRTKIGCHQLLILKKRFSSSEFNSFKRKFIDKSGSGETLDWELIKCNKREGGTFVAMNRIEAYIQPSYIIFFWKFLLFNAFLKSERMLRNNKLIIANKNKVTSVVFYTINSIKWHQRIVKLFSINNSLAALHWTTVFTANCLWV